ncbi:hypothetical protein ACFCXP_37585 [Streptomyces niveus]|uniref:hypothetical protein n=1 Tax=Streptomyces niveus TaxID=193462 RepID=UPI0035D80F8A
MAEYPTRCGATVQAHAAESALSSDHFEWECGRCHDSGASKCRSYVLGKAQVHAALCGPLPQV